MELSFTIEEKASDEFILRVWNYIGLAQKQEIMSFNLGPNEYAELTSTLRDFNDTKADMPPELEMKEGDRNWPVKITRVVTESIVYNIPAKTLGEAFTKADKLGELTHDEIMWNPEAVKVLTPSLWIKEYIPHP